MAERKLNLNAPLLSVRRISAKLISANVDTEKTDKKRLPNGRHSLPFHKPDLINSEQVTEPVAVPFQWEQVPGQAKDHSSEPVLEASRLSQTRILDHIKKQQPLFSSNDNNRANESGRWDSDNDDDDVFSDALDALSPTDSFSFNCSVTTTTNESDALARNKPSGTFSSDPHVRDFMMSRFLPASRAMAVEPSKYASRKQQQQVDIETPRQIVKKVISENKITNVGYYESIVIQRQGRDEGKGYSDNESEDEDEDYEGGSSNISNKVHGFFPRLCFRNSLCLLNPVPGMKVKSHSGKQSKVASVGSHWQSVKKRASDVVCKQNSEAKPREFPKPDQQTASRSSSPFKRSGSGFVSPVRNNTPRSNPGARSCELTKPRSCELTKPERNPHGSGSDRLAYSTDQKTTNTSPFKRSSVNGFVSPVRNVPRLPQHYTGTRSCELPKIDDVLLHNRRSGSAFISPHRNIPRSCEILKTDNKVNSGSYKRSGNGFVSPYRSSGPQSPFLGRDLRGIPKEAQKFTASMLSLNNKRTYKSQEIHLPQSTKQQVRSVTPPIEKTLYVDSENISALLCSNSSCLDTKKGQVDFLVDESGFHSKSGATMEENLKSQPNKVEGQQLDQQFDDELMALALKKINVNGKLDDKDCLEQSQSPLAAPPPLPRTPSESWLGRTLPSLPSRNQARSISPFRSRENLKTFSADTKWETIVKSSYLHHDHGRYSEELKRHISLQFDS